MADGIRLLLGGDSAGYHYKDALLADAREDPRVASVEDLGVNESDPKAGTYPSVAIAAATKIVAGEADRAILVCGTGIGVVHRRQQGARASARPSPTTRSASSARSCPTTARSSPWASASSASQLARRLAKEWLGYAFDPTSHSKANVDEIVDYEDSLERLTPVGADPGDAARSRRRRGG